MRILAIDIGSTSIKGAVVEPAVKPAIGAVVRRPFPEPIAGMPRGHFEVDPTAVVTEVRQVIDQLVSAAAETEAVLFCGQMGGVTLVDRDNRLLTNYISWRDQRTLAPHPAGGSFLDEIHRRWDGDEFRELGSELKPGSATSLLFWLAENGLLPRIAVPLSLGDFVLTQIANAEPHTEPTQAIGTLNLTTADWHHAAFAKLGLGHLSWPPLVHCLGPIGSIRYGNRPIPCFPVVGDQQAALRGVELAEGELSLNISTGSQVSLLSRELLLGNYQTRHYFGGRYLNTITHLPAGRSLNVIVDLLTELATAQGVRLTDPWEYIARSAAEAADSDLAVNLAFFAGPLGELGRIDRITLENLTVASLFRAAFRSMTDNYWTCATRLSPNRAWQGTVLSGGLTQRVPILRQFLAERFGEYRECAEAEDVLLGLAGLWRDRFGS
jgi:sugar (pentulose or hexulose) kinase